MKKKIFILMLLIAVCLTSVSCSGADTDKKAKSAEVSGVYVESEFAPLKKVILSQSEYTDSFIPVSQNYVSADEMKALGAEIRGDYVYIPADSENMKQMEEERKKLAAILERYGVEVLWPRKLTDAEIASATKTDGPTYGSGLTNCFSRDPFIVVGDHVIEANFRKEYRRFEALTARDLFPEGSNYVALPVADISDIEAGPFLEGGDVIVYHKQVFVGNSGYGSNTAGIEWLRNYLSPYGYEVIEVKLQGNILHLDCAMSLVKEGLMIVCEESFADGIPDAFKEWDKITVSEKDAEHLAINGLPVSPEAYITDVAFKDTIGKELEDRGITVEYLDFSATRANYGSVHCSTQPVLRLDS